MFGQDLVDIANNLIARNGDTTIVNGQSLKGIWAEQLASRVQMFLDENEWLHPVYNVKFGGRAVLDPPYSLHNGQEILWQPMGWRGVCRRVSPETIEGMVISVTALVVIQ